MSNPPYMRASRAVVLAAAVCVLVGSAGSPAPGAPRLRSLGIDPQGDGPPSMDLTELIVGRNGKNLEIRFELFGMFPPGGGVPSAPGVEWIFEVKGRTYVAESVPGPGGGVHYLFELLDGGRARQLATLQGTFDYEDGYASCLVPLSKIGARRGTRISGTGKTGTEDVDFHVHAGPQTVYSDKLATDKDYVVP